MFYEGLFRSSDDTLSQLYEKYINMHNYNNVNIKFDHFVTLYKEFIVTMNYYILPSIHDKYDTRLRKRFQQHTLNMNYDKDLTSRHIHTIGYVINQMSAFLTINPNINISFAQGNCQVEGKSIELQHNVQLIVLGCGGERSMHADSYGIYYEKMKNQTQINNIIKNPLYARRGEDYYWKDREHILPGNEYKDYHLQYTNDIGWPMTILSNTSILNSKFTFTSNILNTFVKLDNDIDNDKQILKPFLKEFPVSTHQTFLNSLNHSNSINRWTKMSDVINHISINGGGTLFMFNSNLNSKKIR